MNKPSSKNAPASQRLLLVEDDPVHAQLMQQSLRQADARWHFMHCASGSEALDWIDQPRSALELAVVDMGLPDLGGVEVVRALRRRFGKAPILVVSSVSAERAVLEAIRAGADGYLLKDGDPAAIVRGVAQAMAGHNPISPALARYLFRLAGSPLARETGQFQLSAKELETLQHIGRGRSYTETAELMGVQLSTIQTHVRRLYRKLGVHSQTQAVAKARDSGLL